MSKLNSIENMFPIVFIILGICYNYLQTPDLSHFYVIGFYLIFGFAVGGITFLGKRMIVATFIVSIHQSIITADFVLLGFITSIFNATAFTLLYIGFSKLNLSLLSDVLPESNVILEERVLAIGLKIFLLILTIPFLLILGYYVNFRSVPSLDYLLFMILTNFLSYIAIFPYLATYFNRKQLVSGNSLGNYNDFIDLTPNPKYYILLGSYFSIFSILENLNPFFHNIISFIYLPVLFLTLRWGLIFAVRVNFLAYITFSSFYSILSPNFSIGLQIELHIQFLIWNVIIVFLGLKTSNTIIERQKRNASELQLLFAQKERLVTKMAGNLAHEVNNSSQIIMGNGEILKDIIENQTEITQESREIMLELMNSIFKRTKKTTKIMRDLLTISKSKMTNQEIISLNKEIRQNLKSTYKNLSKGINLVFKSNSIPDIPLDKDHLKEMLLHLIINSVESHQNKSDQSEIIISTNLVEYQKARSILFGEIPSGQYIEICISDSGLGVDENQIYLIFEPYYSTKEISGAGLGLPIVRSLVSLNSGYLHFESQINLGSKVTLYFPIDLSISNYIDLYPKYISKQTVGLDLKLKKILIIDDEKELLILLKNLFSNLKIEVVTFDSPLVMISEPSFLDNISKNFDLIICDVLMPGITGTQLLERLRLQSINIPFLLMSGYQEKLNVDEIKSNRTQFLRKPFSINELFSSVNSLMKEEMV